MHAIVTTSGEIEPKQPFYEITHGGPKAMIPIAGRPMIQWVLDAVGQSGSIERVIVCGLPPETDLDCAHPMVLLPGTGDRVADIQTAAREILQVDPNATHAILVSEDIPTLRGEMVEWLACQQDELDRDIDYTVVERENMESHFPESRQSYTHFKDLDVCAGELHTIRLGAVLETDAPWKQLLGSHKNPLRQASLLGYDTLFFLMLRQLHLADAQATMWKRLGLKGRALLSPYPEVGMRVDKPFQLEIARETLNRSHERRNPSPE